MGQERDEDVVGSHFHVLLLEQVVGRDSGADGKEGNEQLEETGRYYADAGFPVGAGGESPLDDELVGSPVEEVKHHEATEHAGPWQGFVVARLVEVHFLGVGGGGCIHRPHAGPSTHLGQAEHDEGHGQATHQHEDGLYDVGHDDGPQAAQYDVGPGDQGHDQDADLVMRWIDVPGGDQRVLGVPSPDDDLRRFLGVVSLGWVVQGDGGD